MATIITKNSQTASAVPSAASLSVGELAVNTADGKLYTEHTGGVVKEIIPSTVANGGITEAKIGTGAVTADKIGSSAVTEAKIADGAVTTNKLSNSGVSAGTYTTATVTVDAKGRITSAASGSGGGVTSLNGQTGAITNTTIGAIGSYQIGTYLGTTEGGEQGRITYNATVAGSNVVQNINSSIVAGGTFAVALNSSSYYTSVSSGTWRCMTSVRPNPCDSLKWSTLWVRIS